MNLSLPTSLSETEREEQRKIQLFAPLSVSERGWGRGQIRLVELTLTKWMDFSPYYEPLIIKSLVSVENFARYIRFKRIL